MGQSAKMKHAPKFRQLPLAIGGAALTILAPLGEGLAQERAGAQSAVLEEITVTATKRETSLQDTAVSISAFSADALEKAGVSDLQDIDLFTPGLFIGGNGSFGTNGIAIRGIGSAIIGIGGDEAVGVYVDGIFQGRGTGAIFEMADIERVEVVRGPQGTLYGRNATGGAINVVTITPDDEFRGSVDLEATRFGGFAAKGYVVTPLIEGVLSAKFSAASNRNDGYQFNPVLVRDVSGWEKSYASAALRWTPDETSDITLKAYTGMTDVPLVSKNLNDGLPLNITPSDFPTIEEREFRGLTLSGKFSFDSFNVTTLFGYLDSDVKATVDSDSGPIDNVQFRDRENAEQFSGEIRIDSAHDGPIQWIAGVYYFNEKADVRLPFNFFRSVIPGFEAATANPIGLLFAADVETKAYAAFGELSYEATDRLTFTAGLRFSHEEKDWLACIGGFTRFEVDFSPTICDGSFVPDDKTFDVLTPKFVVDFRATDDLLLFASATRGFRSGGWNFTEATLPDRDNGFNEEFVWSYEVGGKLDFLQGRARLNLSAFFADYTDLQVRVTDPVSSLLNTSNAATAEIYGVEAEFQAALTDRLNIMATVSWLDATYSSFSFVQTDGSIVDHSGNRLNRAPEWSASFIAEYAIPIANWGTATPRVEWQYTSEVFHNELNLQPFGSDPFHIVNVRLRAEPDEGSWYAEAYVDNIFAEQYRTHSFVAVLPSLIQPAQISPPSIYGARVGVKF